MYLKRLFIFFQTLSAITLYACCVTPHTAQYFPNEPSLRSPGIPLQAPAFLCPHLSWVEPCPSVWSSVHFSQVMFVFSIWGQGLEHSTFFPQPSTSHIVSPKAISASMPQKLKCGNTTFFLKALKHGFVSCSGKPTG